MSKKKKPLPERPRNPPKMQRHNQVARVEPIKPKKHNKLACRKNKGRKREDD